jgi:hypothetical protein
MSVVEEAMLMVPDKHHSLSAPSVYDCKLVAVRDGLVVVRWGD